MPAGISLITKNKNKNKTACTHGGPNNPTQLQSKHDDTRKEARQGIMYWALSSQSAGSCKNKLWYYCTRIMNFLIRSLRLECANIASIGQCCHRHVNDLPFGGGGDQRSTTVPPAPSNLFPLRPFQSKQSAKVRSRFGTPAPYLYHMPISCS